MTSSSAIHFSLFPCVVTLRTYCVSRSVHAAPVTAITGTVQHISATELQYYFSTGGRTHTGLQYRAQANTSSTALYTTCNVWFNLLKPTGYVTHQPVLKFNNCTLCPHCIYVFCIYLRTNSDLCHSQHKLIGFYNQDKKCLRRGTDWVFK